MEEQNDSELFDTRKSIELTPENAFFSRSTGGLISLDLQSASGEKEFFERVIPIRAFPISAPDEFISICEPDTKYKGHGSEIGMIRTLSDFGEATETLIREELGRRYFTPSITKIHSMKEKFGYFYWNVTTGAGEIEFIMNNPTNSIRTLEDGRMFIYDIDGNCFTIEDPRKLDRASYKKIEIYL